MSNQNVDTIISISKVMIAIFKCVMLSTGSNIFIIFLYNLPLVEALKDKEYLGTVKKMCLNADYAAVMFDNRIQLHLVS